MVKMENILEKIFDKNKKISAARLKNLSQSEKEILNDLAPECKTENVIEKIYWHINNITDYPKRCECGKPVKFENFSKGYVKDFCSLSCKSKSNSIQEKIKKTLQSKYGSEISNCSQIPEIKNQVKQTLLNKFGTNKLFDINKEKRINTLNEKYGVSHISQNEQLKTKRITQFKLNFISKVFENIKELKISPLFSDKEYSELEGLASGIPLLWKCNEHNTEYLASVNNILAFGTPCLICNPRDKNKLESKIADFLSSLNIAFLRNTRKIIAPLELDFYIPDASLAIEVNGVYWHSTSRKSIKPVDKKYHFEKWKICHDKKIKLIQIFEDEFDDIKFEKIKSIIKNSLNKNKFRYFARKCKISELSSREKNEFLIKNHIQGKDKSSFFYGLTYNDELVAIMTFIKPRFTKKYEWEISRFCCKIEYSIVGAASKLFAYFVKKHLPKSVISYADLRFGSGNVYQHLGLNFQHFSSPNYWYVNTSTMTRVNRLACQKHKLPEICGEKFDASLTEHENLTKIGLYEIYDAGNAVYATIF
jgi:hypothetical protein